MFISQVQEAYPHLNETQINDLKERDFAMWLRAEVQSSNLDLPIWFRELSQGPLAKITKAHMYCTRGYVFQPYDPTKQKPTANYGVRVKGDVEFYGVLQEIIEIQYPGFLNLKCVLFKCEWCDPTIGRGVRRNKHGVVDVNAARRYNKFEPFILASQAEQVSFIPYPRLRTTGITWLSVISVAPRGRILLNDDDIPPMQQPICTDMTTAVEQSQDIVLIDPYNRIVEDLDDADDNANGDEEFGFSDELTDDEEEDDEE